MMPYKLIYGKNVTMLMDDQGDIMYIERMIDIMKEVPQLRINAKRTIKKTQQKIEKKFQNEGIKFRKGELVLYFKKVEALCHDTKLEPKWKGPYQIIQVLDKEAYKIILDGKELPKTVNGNLLKKYYKQPHYKPVIIIKSDINRKHIGIGMARINIVRDSAFGHPKKMQEYCAKEDGQEYCATNRKLQKYCTSRSARYC